MRTLASGHSQEQQRRCFRSPAPTISISARRSTSMPSRTARFRFSSCSAAQSSTRARRDNLQVQQIPWDKECTYRMPVQVWQALMDHHYPGTAWLSLDRELFDRLYTYKRQQRPRHVGPSHRAALARQRKRWRLRLERKTRGPNRQRRALRGIHPLPVPRVREKEPPALYLRTGLSRSLQRGSEWRRTVHHADGMPGRRAVAHPGG